MSGYISIKHLDAVSKDSAAKKLTYTVATPPTHGLLYTSATIPDSPVSVFTQGLPSLHYTKKSLNRIKISDDINAGRIYYQLDESTNVDQTSDEFKFDISDSKSKTLSGNIFRIQWSWVNLEQVLYNISETSGEIRIKVKKNQLIFL